MKTEQIIHTFAGFMVIVSVLLGILFSRYWFILTVFVGLNLFQFGFTKFCPLEKILRKLGYKSCCN